MLQRWPDWSLDDVLGSRPRVRVNQVGYLASGPKQATWVTDISGPLGFEVRAPDGLTAFSAQSRPWPVRPEPTSGMSVQVLDFSALRTEGAGYRIEVAGELSHPFAIGDDPYGGLARDALRFFHLQRSGWPVDEAFAPGYGRPAGHVGVPPNRGDTDVPAWQGPDADRLYPGWRCRGRFDVSGGWYDAGDHGKYVVNGGLSVWQLLAVVELMRRRNSSSPWCAELEANLMAECRWELDWMLRMQVPAAEPYAGMAFHRVHGTEWPPLPMWPHEDPTQRVLHRPSTAATLNLAAVAAQAARVFRRTDPAYAERLLSAATTSHGAAHAHPRLLAPNDFAAFGGGPYNDDVVDDEFYWAAVELWLTTGDQPYLDELLRSPCHVAEVFDQDAFDWDTVAAPARLDLATVDSLVPDRERVRLTVLDAADRLVRVQEKQPWGQPYAPDDGWHWGSNGRILNNLVVLATAHDLTTDARYLDATLAGLDYLFGRNALGQSYVTGFGTDYTRHQRTRLFGHDLDPAFPPPPSGAIAGGPNSRSYAGFPADERLAGLPPQCCYLDEPTSEVTNDVCIRWNAPLVWLATYQHLH